MSRRNGVQAVDLRERPSLVLGLLAAGLGLLLLLVPGLAQLLPGNEYVVVGVGAIAFLAGVALVQQRRRATREGAETGDPEVALPVPVPGDRLERDLRRVNRIGHAPLQTRKRVRKRLRESAVSVVRRHERVSQGTAERLVDRGEWTDDPHAALFVGDPSRLPSLSIQANLQAAASLRSRFGFEAHRTARAVLELAGRSGDAGPAIAPASGDEAVASVAPGPASDDRTRPYDRRTRRWTGVGALALVAGAAGMVFEQSGAVLVAVVGVAYAAFAFRSRPPTVELAVERSLTVDGEPAAEQGAADPTDGAAAEHAVDAVAMVEDLADEGAGDERATGGDTTGDSDEQTSGESTVTDGGGPSLTVSPGEAVEVTLTVENVGEATLPDLRLVDGVPPGLTVVDGSPRLGTALRPGRSATFSYRVEAARGDHEFGPMQVIARDASGDSEREDEVPAPGRLTCRPELTDAGSVPLYGAATRYTGRVSTETGGEGIEFHATRDYRPGDPPGRVDWNRYARTGDLSTLLFREERAATVVLLVDTRETAYRAPGGGEPHAVARSVDAAGRTFESLLAGGDRVGIASFGPRECWIPPGAGTTHREAVRRRLATDPAFSHAPPEEKFLPSARLAGIRQRAPVDAQFVLFTPLTDGYVATVARRLQAHGYPMTVVSPDVTTGGSTGRRLAQVERQTRLNALREAGLRVVDWSPEEDLAVAIREASAGWSA